MYYIERSPKTEEYTLAFLNEEGRKQYILSKYEPKKQALKVLENSDLGNKSTIWILFGFQFGYLVDRLIEIAGENINILIIEPDRKLLEEELKIVEKDYKKNPNIVFFTGEDWHFLKRLLEAFIGGENFNNYRIIPNTTYLTYYKEYYKTVIDLVNQCIENKELDYHTVILGNTYGTVNTIRNRYDLVKTCDLLSLENKFKDIPAVLVLAGPSLDKNIEYLKKFNGLIFVVGRTMTPVMNLGVKPDLVFALDPYRYSLETFGEYQKYDVPLFTLGQCADNVVKGCQSPYKYFLYNANDLHGLLGIRINPCLDLSGSVATLCLSTAQFLGCSPILFIGQDLAYSGDRMYATNADKLYTPKQMKTTWGLREIKSYYGDEVYSDAKMINYLRWIEKFIYDHPSSKYINCTEGGAYIEGAKHIPFKEAIDLCNPTEKVKIHHEFLKVNEGIDIDKNLIEGIKGIQLIQKYIHQSVKDFDKLIYLYQEKKPGKKRDKQAIQYVQQIEKRDKEIQQIERVKFLMNMLLERVKPTISASNDCKEPLHETQEEFRLRYIRVNKETYEYIEKECDNLLELLIKELPQELQAELEDSNDDKVKEEIK